MAPKIYSDNSKLCLATVTTNSFVPGTLVMIYSFLKHNKWFDGEITIFHDGLLPENIAYIANIYERISFLEISSELQGRIGKIADQYENKKHKKACFYALETFRLRNFDRVLFCDSDLLFRESIEDLLSLPQELIVCGDGYHYQKRARKWISNSGQDETSDRAIGSYENTFNSGFMLIHNNLLTDENYKKMLELVERKTFEKNPAKLADQLILNIYFAGRQHIISAKYNFVLAHRRAIQNFEGLTQDQAAVFHFNGVVKPWRAEQVLFASQRDPSIIKAVEAWFESYIECLQSLYIQTRLSAAGQN